MPECPGSDVRRFLRRSERPSGMAGRSNASSKLKKVRGEELTSPYRKKERHHKPES